MSVKVFVDTNVVLYSLDRAEPGKQARCAAWLNALAVSNTMTISPQVCSETRSAGQKKLRLSIEHSREAARRLLPWCAAPLGAQEVARALEMEARLNMSWWDALIVASALGAGCTHLLTEDAQSSGTIQGLIVVDPFRTDPEDLLAPLG